MPSLKKILVPIDFSAGSRGAIDEAVFLAGPFGATIDLLHAWELPPYVGADTMLLGPDNEQTTLYDFTRRTADRSSKEWGRRYRWSFETAGSTGPSTFGFALIPPWGTWRFCPNRPRK